MNWTIIFLAIATLLSWAAGDFLIQKSARKIGVFEIAFLIGIFGTISLFPFVYKDLRLLLNFENMIFSLVLGLICFVATYLSFKAIKDSKLSVVEFLLQIELPITAILSILFFHETLSHIQIALFTLILTGLFLISSTNVKSWRKNLEKGILIGISAGIVMGLLNFLIAGYSKKMTPLLAIWVPWTMIAIISVPLIISKRKEIIVNTKKYFGIILLTCIVNTLAWILFSFAVQNNPASIITAITESYPAFALILGVWINKEQLEKHQYIGAGIALIASLILAATL